MNTKKKIVFFTKSFDRTGSEILLLQLINTISSDFEVEFFSLYKGQLYNELNPAIKKGYLLKSSKRDSFFSKLKTKLAFGYALPFKLFRTRNHTWYINTIVLPGILQYAKRNSVKTILHCHELEPMFAILNPNLKHDTIHFPSLVIANSQASAEIFRKNARKKSLEISYPFIDPSRYAFDHNKYLLVRRELGIKEGEFTWLMCGTMDNNKNPQLFIELAKRMKQAKFIWLGNNKDNPLLQAKLINDTKNIPNLIWVTDKSALYKDYINASDGFVLTSQFESFSIVTLEALAAGKPVVANNCVGVNEILHNDLGKVISPKNDISQFIAEMQRVMERSENPEKEKGMARSREFSMDQAIQHWNALLKQHLL